MQDRNDDENDEYFKVDIHAHILPENIPKWHKDFGYTGFIYMDHKSEHKATMMHDTGEFFRDVESNLWDPEVRIEEMNKTGVDVQVLSTVPVMYSYWAEPEDTLEVSKYLNDNIAKTVQDYPTRFVGIGTLPLNDPELAAQELDRCVNELGFPGVEIGTHILEFGLNHKRFEPFFERADELGAAIFVHPWDMPWKEADYWTGWLAGMPAETSKTICDLIFGGIFERYPNINFAFAHGGGSFPGTIGRIEHGYNVRPDLCQVDNDINPREYLGHFWTDSLVADPEVLDYNISVIGEDKIALGSDYPFPLGEHHPGEVIDQCSASIDSKHHMMGDAALDWLGIGKDRFE